MKKKAKGKKKQSTPEAKPLTVSGLFRLLTRTDPQTPVVLVTSKGGEQALANTNYTGHGQVEIDGVATTVLLIGAVMRGDEGEVQSGKGHR